MRAVGRGDHDDGQEQIDRTRAPEQRNDSRRDRKAVVTLRESLDRRGEEACGRARQVCRRRQEVVDQLAVDPSSRLARTGEPAGLGASVSRGAARNFGRPGSGYGASVR